MSNHEIYKSLIQIQSNLKTIQKNKTAVVKGTSKSGQPYEYQFKYADYTSIIEGIKKPMADAKLGFTHQMIEGVLVTSIIHESGESLTTSSQLPSIADPQKFASWLTYFKRYHLGSLLGIATDEDVDAAGVDDESGLSDSAIQEFTRVQVECSIVEKDFCQWLCGVDKLVQIPAAQENRLLSALSTIEAKHKGKSNEG